MSYILHNSVVTYFGHSVEFHFFGGYIIFSALEMVYEYPSFTSVILNKALSIGGLILKRL